MILSDGRSHGPYPPSDSNSQQAQSDSGAAAPVLMPGPRRRSTNRPLHSAFSLRPTYEMPALHFDTGHRTQAQLQAQDDWQHSQQQALPPAGEQQPPQQQEPRQQRQAACAAGPTQPHNFTGDSAWSHGGAHSTASDTLLFPQPRDAEVEEQEAAVHACNEHAVCISSCRVSRFCMPMQVDALEAELADMRNAVSSPMAGRAPDPKAMQTRLGHQDDRRCLFSLQSAPMLLCCSLNETRVTTIGTAAHSAACPPAVAPHLAQASHHTGHADAVGDCEAWLDPVKDWLADSDAQAAAEPGHCRARSSAPAVPAPGDWSAVMAYVEHVLVAFLLHMSCKQTMFPCRVWDWMLCLADSSWRQGSSMAQCWT